MADDQNLAKKRDCHDYFKAGNQGHKTVGIPELGILPAEEMLL